MLFCTASRKKWVIESINKDTNLKNCAKYEDTQSDGYNADETTSEVSFSKTGFDGDKNNGFQKQWLILKLISLKWRFFTVFL